MPKPEAILTIWPEPCFSISAAARWVMWKKPATLVAILALKSSAVYSVNGLAMNMPAS